MAGELASAFIKIRADSRGFRSEIEREVHGSLRSISHLIGAAGVGAGLGGVFTSAIDEFVEAAKVGAKTDAVLRATGGSAGVTAGHVGDLADQLLRVSGVDDELIKSGENVLLRFRNIRNEAGAGRDIFDQATRAALDFSVATGQDVPNAARVLGRSLDDPVRALTLLRRAGINFTAQQAAQIKGFVETGNVVAAQQVVLERFNSTFGGTAAAVGSTLPGQLRKFREEARNALGDATAATVDFTTRVAGSVEAQKAAADAGHAFHTTLAGLEGTAKALDGPLLGVAHGAQAIVDAVGVTPLIAGAVAYKGLGIATAGAAAAQTFYNRALLLGAAESATEAAAIRTLTAAQLEQTAAALAGGGRAALLGRGITSMIGPAGLATAGVIALGFGIDFLARHEDNGRKASEALTSALGNLDAAFNARNLLAERSALEDIERVLKRADAAFLSTGETVDLFVKGLRGNAEEQRNLSPRVAHNIDLLADFTRAIDRLPTQKEIAVIIDNRRTRTSLLEILDQIRQLGPQGEADAKAAGVKLGGAIADGFRDGVSPFQIPIIGPSALDKALAATQPAAERAGNATGAAFIRGLQAKLNTAAGGLKDANSALAQAFADQAEQINQAISAAKTNLGSIASELGSSVASFIDARTVAQLDALDKSPLAREIKALQASLDKTSAREQRAQLEFQIGQASDDATRRNAIQQLREFDLQTKLATDTKKLDSEKTALQKAADAQKQAVAQNLAAYADSFAKGQITLAQFSGRVLAALHGQIKDFGQVGDLLGKAFRSQFDAEIQGLLDQAEALAVVPKRPGGTAQVEVTKPSDVIARTQRDIEEKQKARDDAALAEQKAHKAYLKAISDKLDGKTVPQSKGPPGSLTNPVVVGARGGAKVPAG